jgi:hypothetical protein
MRRIEALELLTRWERELPVTTWTVDGLRVWPLLRIRIAAQLTQTKPHAAGYGPLARVRIAAGAVLTPLRQAWHQRSAQKRDRGHELSVLDRADALFLTHTTCRQRLGDAFYDVFCDPLIDVLERDGRRALVLESAPGSSDFRVPRWRQSHFIETEQRWLAARSLLTSGLGATHQEVKLPQFERLAADLSQRGLLAAAPSLQRLKRWSARLQRLAAYFEAILRTTIPRVVFSVTYFSDAGMALNLAARRAGIPSVDIQHGVLAEHSAYAGFAALPAQGYELLPEVFWTWSEKDAAVIRGWQAPAEHAHRAIVGGQPWACAWQAEDLPRRFASRLDAILPRDSERVVLVTLQWDEGLSPLMRSVLAQADGRLHFWIRLHPHMTLDDRAEIAAWCARSPKLKFHLDEPSELPLPLLLRATHVHLTRFSTVVIEAAAAGVASVVLDRNAVDLFAEAARAGYMIYESDPHAILQRLSKLAAHPLAPYGDLGTHGGLKTALLSLLHAKPGATNS